MPNKPDLTAKEIEAIVRSQGTSIPQPHPTLVATQFGEFEALPEVAKEVDRLKAAKNELAEEAKQFRHAAHTLAKELGYRGESSGVIDWVGKRDTDA